MADAYHGAAFVLQEESQEEAGLGEDAAALFCHLVARLLPVPLQQVQQRLHGALHSVHGLGGLMVLREGDRRRVKGREREERSGSQRGRQTEQRGKYQRSKQLFGSGTKMRPGRSMLNIGG